ncbi:hypothetical protein BC940DRAFT_101665 [Gongronella butleri]|nr:hypothetical protein BC940DRAFT_101665 [Gongronella butleri]
MCSLLFFFIFKKKPAWGSLPLAPPALASCRFEISRWIFFILLAVSLFFFFPVSVSIFFVVSSHFTRTSTPTPMMCAARAPIPHGLSQPRRARHNQAHKMSLCHHNVVPLTQTLYFVLFGQALSCFGIFWMIYTNDVVGDAATGSQLPSLFHSFAIFFLGWSGAKFPIFFFLLPKDRPH